MIPSDASGITKDMRIGITGHQARPGIDWGWVRTTLRTEIANLNGVKEAMSSLAVGSDQVFADVCLALSIPLTAVIPTEGYERFFESDGLLKYRDLLSQSRIVQLRGSSDDEDDFLRAGLLIAEQSDLLFAVWDGRPSKGKGGTGDIVANAKKSGRTVTWLNTTDETVNTYRKGVEIDG